ncbi:hypothetical protein GOAMR_80_00260 [Gordonia amarae NBRC 15530]|uniref:DUF4139 domain-containing protein n=2 Tax=Gordonia amarae TaxID=36821 RepID=G7GWV8_9ACTN|nr:hypothetical protein GOAMR_80_00260 [Gordonia amarae NBRC 15530]
MSVAGHTIVAMTTRPAVTRLVLFKHGIAYLERSGPADSDFELSFRKGDMNDVLKSLSVGVVDGDATVGALAYEAPTDPDDELARRNLYLEPGQALPGLLAAVRGRTVEVRTADGTTHRGEVVGVDENSVGSGGTQRLLAIRTRDAGIGLVDLSAVRALGFADDSSREDLAYLIDRSRAATAGENRTVRVSVNGRADRLDVSYVLAAPVWRISYRLVRSGDAVTLIAMGIVHNPVDEDLTDIELTLTTGQPVSFDIDLYNARWAERAMIEESERGGVVPTSYEQAYGALDMEPTGAPPMLGAAPAPRAAKAMARSFAAEALAETGAAGEYFEYRVGTPVSLKRGTAAMVPLTVAEIDSAVTERIWREESGPNPDIVLSFDNSSGIVLEEGPAVIYDDESYAGESMMPYTTRGTHVRLGFARDLAVRCRRTSETTTVTTRLHLDGDALVAEMRHEEIHTIRVEHDGDAQTEVIIELPKGYDTRLMRGAEYLAPFEETAGHNRFRVPVSGRGKAEVKVGEARVLSRYTAYADLTGRALGEWLSQRLLDRTTFAELSAVVEHWEQARRCDEKVKQLEAERKVVYDNQSRVAEQLKVLHDGGEEGQVRARTVASLVSLQDRETALDADITTTRTAAADERAAADEQLRRLVRR